MAETKQQGTEEVLVLWNGGWDKYLVDETSRVFVPEHEFGGNKMYSPTFVLEGRTYLKTKFNNRLKLVHGETSGVLVIEHLDGGD